MDEKLAQKKVNDFEDVCFRLTNIFAAKNRDYGDSFSKSFDQWGLVTTCVRLGDKFNRLCSFAENKEMRVKNESVIDTLMDAANYCIMTILELENNKEETK